MSSTRDTGDGDVKLFGVTLMKNAPTVNFSCNTQFDIYAIDGFVRSLSTSPHRKRGIPWTEEEHRLFLTGLEKLGKGDWRGISRSFVITRTPTQVASHAQKYFLRQNHATRTKRRSRLFDIRPRDDCNPEGGSSQLIMAARPPTSSCSNIELMAFSNTMKENSTGGEIEENGCGLSLSIAPPSIDSFQVSTFYGKINGSGNFIRVV